MEKSGLRYSFEKVHGRFPTDYQVRLNGEFVMYTDQNNSAAVDKELEHEGFTSRREVLDYIVEERAKKSLKS